MRKKSLKKKNMTQAMLVSRYGLTPGLIRQYFPEPVYVNGPSGSPIKTWSYQEVQAALANPELSKKLRRIAEQRERRIRKEQQLQYAMVSYLNGFTLENLLRTSSSKNRKVILHIGPTNSGKTYESLQRLKQAKNGVYLGPLRLLALEVFDKLNLEGCPCNLVTGEEQEWIPSAVVTASTIEMCDFSQRYDVAVIDEAQMLDDPARGAHWTKAILGIPAEELHICMAPPAETIICRLLEKMGETPEIHYHERLVPLVYTGKFDNLKDTRPGDALITFSRKSVLDLAARLENEHISASVIYGSLPPASRREEVRRFTEKETSVVVATDAIGMGVSMPIKRIVFMETQKFDGDRRRGLHSEEIKQIAGRAGRFGIYSLGEVACANDTTVVEDGLKQPSQKIQYVRVPFPVQALDSNFDLEKLLKVWEELPTEELAKKESVSDELFLLNILGKEAQRFSKNQLYQLISCPVDIKNEELVQYWLLCCLSIRSGEDLPLPYFNTLSLEGCEKQYRAYDIYCQLSRRIGLITNCEKEKNEICRKIAELLKTEKDEFVRKCRYCGKTLPLFYPYGVCENCYSGRFRW